MLAAVLGDVGGAELGDLARRHAGGVAPEDLDAPADLAAHPGDRLDELALAVALDAGDAEDLPAAHLDREPVDGLRRRGRRRTRRSRTRSTTSPGAAASFSTWNTTSRPTIRLASDCCVAVFGSAVPATRPSRSTVIRSATASTSRSLWVMKMIDLPWSTRLRTTAKKSSTSPGREHGGRLVEDQDVGLAEQRLDELDALLLADREVADLGVGVDASPYCVAELADPAAGLVDVEQPPLGELVAEDHVLGDREHRDQLEVLVHHADAAGDGVVDAVEAAPARRARGSCPRRAGRARTRRSSACSCRRRSRPSRQWISPSWSVRSTSSLAMTPGNAW